jgi:hemerythrin-like domain-containing protein
MSAIEMLEEEHKVILRMVKVLTTMHDRLDSDGSVDTATLMEVVDFFRNFADKGHHAKEEDVLFPMLERNGVRSQGCPIGTLTNEHKQGRMLITALNDAIDKYDKGDSTAKATISATIKGAIDLYTNHIWREDYLLFPMSQKVLPKPELDGLRRNFNEVDTKFGSDFHSRYEQLVEKLEKSFDINREGGP